MVPALKRKATNPLSSISVSPPPLRRRRVESAHSKVSDSHDKYSPQQLTTVPTEASTANNNNDHMVLYSWNVNGINPLLQKRLSFTPTPTTNQYPLRTFLREHNWPHVLCLQEVKIARHDVSTQRHVEMAANAGHQPSEPSYTTHFSLPRDKYNATGFGGKVYGVATLIRDDNVAVTSRPDWDLEGRVLIHDFPAQNFVVINGYWVNGTSNPYRDPETGLVSGTRHDQKLRFHGHMLDLCKSLVTENKHVLLLGDMNVARSRIDGYPNLRESPVQHVRNRADFNGKFFTDTDGFNGVDVFRHLHGDRRKYTYHGRGRPWGQSCDRVDMIIASSGFVEAQAIVATDICDNPKDRGHSDHVPLWIEINCARLEL